MKKQLRNLGLAIATIACASTGVHAQALPPDGIIGMFGDSRRVLVNTPSSVPSPNANTFAGSGAGAWGGPLITPINNVQVIRAIGTGGGNTDSLLCTPAANGTGGIPALTGRIAILYRGTCNFSDKAYTAQLAGAVAVIIVNNIPGAPIPMASGMNGANVNIPVFMVSDVDGGNIMAALRNNTAVSMTMSRWSLGSANDIGIMPKSSVSAHAGAIPASQLATSNGNPTAYRMFNGAMAINFGTATQTNLKNATTIQWIPTGGVATQVYTDTSVLASLAPADSLDLVFNTSFYNPHATSKGTYTITSRIIPSGSDAITGDNIQTRTVYVTDSIYCKGTWNNTTMRPEASLARPADANNPWSWGPLIYTAVGGSYPSKLQFTLANGAANASTLDQAGAFICAFRWTDGAGGNATDGIIQEGELSLVAQGYKGFTSADSNFSNIIIPFNSTLTNGGPVISPLASNSWYYYTITPSAPTIYVGVDNSSNDYMRMFVSNKVSPATREYLSPQFLGEATQIPNGATGDFRMVPYYLDADVPIDSVAIDLSGRSVNAALHTTNTAPVSIGNQINLTQKFTVSPNPSNGQVSLNYAFQKDMGNAMITVFNGMGQAIMTKKASGSSGIVEFDLSNAAAGTYWIIYGSSMGTESRQFQIIK